MPFVIAYLIADANKLRKAICTPLLLFYVSVVFATLISGVPSDYFVPYDFLTTFARLCYYAVLILVARSRFTLKGVLQIYLVATTVFALYLIVQYMYHLLIGGYLPTVIDRSWIFAPELTYATYEEKYRWSFRASSAFLEPSYYVLFTSPALAISIMGGESEGRSSVRFILLLLTYVLANASSGILLSVVALLVFVVKKKKSQKDYIVGTLLCAALLVYLLVGNYSFIEPAVERLSSGASFDNRITRGLLVFNELPPINKLFGVGLNNLEPYMLSNGLSTAFDEKNLNYSASFIQTLNYAGLFGFTFLVGYLIGLGKRCKSPICVCLFVLILVIMTYESILYSFRFAFLIVILESFIRVQDVDCPKDLGKMHSQGRPNRGV